MSRLLCWDMCMRPEVTQPSQETIKALGCKAWPVWEKEASRFEWHYDSRETCYILEGKVLIELTDGHKLPLVAGDLVVFPAGLSCVWNIKRKVRKHYCFE